MSNIIQHKNIAIYSDNRFEFVLNCSTIQTSSRVYINTIINPNLNNNNQYHNIHDHIVIAVLALYYMSQQMIQ